MVLAIFINMSTILVTGGTGLIGTELVRMLRSLGHRVLVLSRDPKSEYRWDPEAGTIDPEAIRQADHIIHLAGAGVADERWTL